MNKVVFDTLSVKWSPRMFPGGFIPKIKIKFKLKHD